MFKFDKLFDGNVNWRIADLEKYAKFFDKKKFDNFCENWCKFDGKNIMTFAVASQLFLTGCATTQTNYKYSQKAVVLTKIDKKIEDNTLTFDDVFYTDYGEYAEKTEQTEEELDALVAKYKQYVKGVDKTFGGKIKLAVDKILLDNIDKVADIIADKNNFTHGIYGTNEKQWFKKDENEKAPLNYFQQQFLLQADKETLKQISLKVVDRILYEDKEHIIGIGILWVVFGNGYQLTDAFDKLNVYVSECGKSVNSGKVLTKKQEKFLNELKHGKKNIENFKTDGIEEYFSKISVKKKFDVLLKNVDGIFTKSKDNSRKNKNK